jgi:tight adherence protein C
MPALLLLAALLFAAAAAALVRSATPRHELRSALERAARLGVPAPAAAGPSGRRRTLLVDRLARVALTVRPGASREEVALRLAGAGLARRVTPEAYLALQAALGLAGLALGLLVAVAGSPTRGLVLALLVGGLALVVPDRLVASRAGRRRELVLAELPGALDLLAISVQAGLGFDAALARVSEATEGPLSEEFGLMLAELRVGETRQTALQRLADRVRVREVATFARAVARAEQLGMPLAQTLRVQAADVRARRQVAAEERAGKAPVKMLFPTVVFIFPPLFVVVLGPTLLTLSKFL